MLEIKLICDIHNWYTIYSLGKQIETGKILGKAKECNSHQSSLDQQVWTSIIVKKKKDLEKKD